MILLDLRVHRAGVDRLGAGRRSGGIALERQAALRAGAGLVRFYALAHRAKIGGGGREFDCRMSVVVLTGMSVRGLSSAMVERGVSVVVRIFFPKALAVIPTRWTERRYLGVNWPKCELRGPRQQAAPVSDVCRSRHP